MLVTTNNGPAYLYRNDQLAGNRSIRFRLIGTESNRDAHRRAGQDLLRRRIQLAHGAERIKLPLSQSELPVTFGIGKRDAIDRAVIRWPNGRVEEFKNLKAGRYDCVEGKGVRESA